MWDAKRGKFRARVTVEGRQVWLGSYDTEAEAAAAYERIRGPRRAVRRQACEAASEQGRTAAQAVEAIQAQAAANWRGEFEGRPEPVRFEVQGFEMGDLFTVERPGVDLPQGFEFQGKTWARWGGRTWALWRWRTCCVRPDCGEAFEVTTPADVRRMTVPTAHCPAHRRRGRPRKAGQVLPQPEGGARGARGSGGQISGPSGDARGGGPGGLREQADLLGVGDLV